MSKFYKLGEAAKYIGCHPKTLEKYDRDGTLVAYRTKTNRRYYTKEQLDDFLGKRMIPVGRANVSYVRVSSLDYTDELKDYQTLIRKYAMANGQKIDIELIDYGSNFDLSRTGFQQLINDIEHDLVDKIYLLSIDQLLATGYQLFVQLCQNHNCQIVVLQGNQVVDNSEAMTDLLFILDLLISSQPWLENVKKYLIRKNKEQQLGKKGNN